MSSKEDDDKNDNISSNGDNIPPAAAAAASSSSSSSTGDHDDMTMAQALQMVETLTSLFGFSYDAANEAVNVIGSVDLQACCDYILDQGLGVDGGGAIAPKDDCPHLQHAMHISSPDISSDVFIRPCCYYNDTNQNDDGLDKKKMPMMTTTTTTSSTTDPNVSVKPTEARLKDDIDESTGVCPMGENWMCLTCGDVYCSRYVNGHGLCHWKETAVTASDNNGHCVLVSLTDLSVWCNVCGAYLVHQSLQPVVQRLQQIKFPEEEKRGNDEPASKPVKSAENIILIRDLLEIPIASATFVPKGNVPTTRNRPITLPSFASTSRPVRQCPCKLLPRSFSSFTAAEYGDLYTLARIGPAIARRRDEFGYTPLHLASQNNHVAATALLLQLGCHVDGLVVQHEGGPDAESIVSSCGATPLHRAAFSGATAAMKILLEWNNTQPNNSSSTHPFQQRCCDLLAKDTSFGDEATPLHKAAAGGRYLAIQLLLDVLRQKQVSHSPNDTSLLNSALQSKNKMGRTPLDVAQHYLSIHDSERHAVARWDEVAGGPPDWSKCVQLLEDAERRTAIDSVTGQSGTKKEIDPTPKIPQHLTSGVNACMDCENNGQCFTKSWEDAFQKALLGSAGQVWESAKRDQQQQQEKEEEEESLVEPKNAQNNIEADEPKHDGHGKDDSCTTLQPESEISRDGSMGLSCANCRTTAIALYVQSHSNQLVCKRCL
ncbi:ankyrin repeat domain protein [Nitzschia inconspicua]|uniref:Ankyrin repeat domain protein n=1 Tax=Nitzschia inconspicua TaxID=303405 RepID=A0A9K3M345_9STRA|nr:ankyrin repeat domain protein [Nitzschia inconspicua]